MKYRWSERIYRLMLRLYPAQHRAEYGEAMLQHFRDLSREADAQRSKCGFLYMWIHLMRDTATNAPVEQWIEIRAGGPMRSKTTIMTMLAVLGALFVGYIDSHTSEVQATLMVMLPITFILGFIEPKRAALWVLIIGLSVPLSYLFVLATGQHYTDPPPNGFTTLIALVPAFVGTFSGVIFRMIVSQVATPNHP